MNGYTIADLRAWGLICALIALTGVLAARFAQTGAGFLPLTAFALASVALIIAWARRRALLERKAARS